MTPEQASQSYITLRQQRDAGQLPDARFPSWWRNW